MCHVLIIEDESLIAHNIADILEGEGATSFAFATTQDAAIEAAESQKPDFITSDVRLLTGTGPAAVAVIQERFGEIPVLFITATPSACEPCAPPGRVISKPASDSKIAQAFFEMRAD